MTSSTTSTRLSHSVTFRRQLRLHPHHAATVRSPSRSRKLQARRQTRTTKAHGVVDGYGTPLRHAAASSSQPQLFSSPMRHACFFRGRHISSFFRARAASQSTREGFNTTTAPTTAPAAWSPVWAGMARATWHRAGFLVPCTTYSLRSAGCWRWSGRICRRCYQSGTWSRQSICGEQRFGWVSTGRAVVCRRPRWLQ